MSSFNFMYSTPMPIKIIGTVDSDGNVHPVAERDTPTVPNIHSKFLRDGEANSHCSRLCDCAVWEGCFSLKERMLMIS